MVRKLSVVAGVALAFAGASVQAKDFEALLKGDYAFSGEATCLVSVGGFDADLTPVDAPAPFPRVQSFSVNGIRTFNGDGTGRVVARVVTLAHPFALPTAPTPIFNRGGAGSIDIESDFTYTVTPALEVVVQTPLVTGTVLTGTRAGQTMAITNLPLFQGNLSANRQGLTLAHNEPGVEHHAFSNGDSDFRICHRSRIFLERRTSK